MPSKVIAILQPVYLPWLGYFEQVAYADHFVFYDDVQYTKQDWRNRNQIAGANGPVWLTVPVRRAALGTPICEIEIDHSRRWADKHLKSIRQAYGRTPHFATCLAAIEPILQHAGRSLADLDIALIKALTAQFGLSTEFTRSSQMALEPPAPMAPEAQDTVARRNMRLIEICHALEGGVFYVGARAEAYIDTALFARHGIDVVFQNYKHPTYPQPATTQGTHLAAIDLLMHAAPQAQEILLSSPPPSFANKTA